VSHHTHADHTSSAQASGAHLAWTAALNITAAAIALVLYRTTQLGIVVALLIGFVASAAVTGVAYALTHRPTKN
jgi:hypothetical protein